MGDIADRIQRETGYGTLGHLVEILIMDREIHGHDDEIEEKIIRRAIDTADAMWDGFVGPMLDEMERELL